MSKDRISYETKLYAVEDYITGKRTSTQIVSQLQINLSSFRKWVLNYQSIGAISLMKNSKLRLYSREEKDNAIADYLNGIGSLDDICKKYQIPSRSILHRWIKRYNNHETIKSHNATGEKIMIKGRNTTYDERVEIVSFCIENNDNYQMAAEKYQVSYQQAYMWTRKYRTYGFKALADRRGKLKPLDELTETEKLVAQLKLLEAENKKLQMENDFLKKLKEVERRREQNKKTDTLP